MKFFNKTKILPIIIMSCLLSCANINKNDNPISALNQPLNPVLQIVEHNKNSEHLTQFLTGYQKISDSSLTEAKEIFNRMVSSDNKTAQEYGLFGLILASYEIDHMLNMKNFLTQSAKLPNKSPWFKKMLTSYNILYHYSIADFAKTKQLIDKLSEDEIINNSVIAFINTNLLIRDDELEKANLFLQKVRVESEEIIVTKATLLELSVGNKEAVKYLTDKINTYPDSEYLQLVRNDILLSFDEKKARKQTYQLGLKTNNGFILLQSILFLAKNNPRDDIKELGDLLEKVYKIDDIRQYIEYNLLEIAISYPEQNAYNALAQANQRNPKNYQLLWYKYYIVDDDKVLDALKQLEDFAPYDNYILLELAHYYHKNNMKKESSEIQKRFYSSKRIKSDEMIKIMKSYD